MKKQLTAVTLITLAFSAAAMAETTAAATAATPAAGAAVSQAVQSDDKQPTTAVEAGKSDVKNAVADSEKSSTKPAHPAREGHKAKHGAMKKHDAKNEGATKPEPEKPQASTDNTAQQPLQTAENQQEGSESHQ